MSIQLVITGGTIDKTYNELTGKLGFHGKSQLPAMLKQCRCEVRIEQHSLFMIDSLDMKDSQRQEIVDFCQNSDSEQIIISHGTDSMAETASLLAKEVKNKCIVLFGAMIPFTLKNSDALFNLGTAITAVQNKKNGCYISMNGQVFDALHVQKNKQQGIFEAY